MTKLFAVLFISASIVVCHGPSFGQAPEVVPAVEKGNEFSGPKTKPPAVPQEFAFVFSLPYAVGDEYPLDPEEFERMLVLLKSAGFNTVHCVYKDWRHELFKKHKMKMMVDVLAWKAPSETDIRRNEEQRALVKATCIKARDSDAIWGYNLWNERLDWVGDFKQFDLLLRMLRTWDPTHPVWVGTYTYYHAESYPTNPGVLGYYDYHWQRGHHWHFHMLSYYHGLAEKRQSRMGRWMGLDGYNRSLYTLNTSIAYGLKTGMWFIGGPYASREPDLSKRWNDDYFLNKIGRHMQPTYKLIGEMGHPVDVYSTATRRTAENKEKKLEIPAKTTAFPKDHWLQIEQGEVLCGFFKMPDKSDVVWIANHNVYAWQGVVMALKPQANERLIVSRFDRGTSKWVTMGAQSEVNFGIPPADARVYRFQRVKATDAPSVDDGRAAADDYEPRDHLDRIKRVLSERGELAGGKQPIGVYSSTTFRTKQNREKKEGLPAGTSAVPDDFWVQIKQGEMLTGVYNLKDGSYAVCFANHNALSWQGGLIVPKQDKEKPIVISEFDQEMNQWVELGAWGDVNFPLKPAGSAVFRFKETKPQLEGSKKSNEP
jgi:hypothetical protein